MPTAVNAMAARTARAAFIGSPLLSDKKTAAR
jgi:hypothetical protein